MTGQVTVFAVVFGSYDPPEVYSLWWTRAAAEEEMRRNGDSMLRVIELQVRS